MGYVEENNAMFAGWKKLTGRVPGKTGYDTAAIEIDHANTVFIRDGVVCPELWFAQRTRPLFLLKEAYNGDGDWDLAGDHLLTSDSASRMWRRVSRWTYALLNTTAEELAPYDPGLDVSKYGNEYLRRIAVVNVKKSGDKNSSNMDEIRSYAWFDAQRLWKQLSLCDPTVIVCGYTGSALARQMLDEWNRYVDDFIQVTPIEYKRVLAEEQMLKLQQKIAEVQRDY